jgi:hypothetical protein
MPNHLPLDSNRESIEMEEIETLLRTYRPTPESRLRERIASATWMKSADTLTHHEARLKNVSMGRRSYARLAFAFLSVLVLISLLFLSPMGRGLAQSISQFFRLAPFEQVTEVVPLTPFQTPNPEYPYNLYTLTIDQAESLAGFKVKRPTNLPHNWVFRGASYEAENQQVELFYTLPAAQPFEGSEEDIYLYVSQLKGEFEVFEWGQCPNGTIEAVTVNGWPAELADGVVWMTTTPATPGITRQWECQQVEPGFTMTLRWKEEELKYEINISQFAEDISLWLTKEDLISLAENMK